MKNGNKKALVPMVIFAWQCLEWLKEVLKRRGRTCVAIDGISRSSMHGKTAMIQSHPFF